MRHIYLNEDMICWRSYAKKRAARILPSYYFAVLVTFFFFALPSKAYPSTQLAIKDLLTHLTFTQTLFVSTYLQTKCGVVLWTVAVEVWFYILFPFIAEALKKCKTVNNKKAMMISSLSMVFFYAVMVFASYYWRKAYVLKPNAYVAMYINQLPAFMGTYANGMLSAAVFVLITKYAQRTRGLSAAATILSAFTVVYISMLVNECARLPLGEAQIWQVTNRFKLTAAFSVFILSAALSFKCFRFVFSNRLMKFLNLISYNLYIWHQWLCVQIKYSWRIPKWTGDTPPNQLGDSAWMNKYALIITAAAFIAAIAATFLIEKTFSELILNKRFIKKKK